MPSTGSATRPDADPGREFFRWAHDLVVAEDPRFDRLGPLDSLDGIDFPRLARSVRRSIWHMTVMPTWPEVRLGRPLADAGGRPGIDYRYATSRTIPDRLPLLSSHHRSMRVGPTEAALLIVDASVVFLGGPSGHPLSSHVFRSRIPRIVDAAMRYFETVWSRCDPPLEPTFTPRMVDIAFLLTDGANDREIAAELGVSERTVSSEVAEIIRRIGARNRAHAIARIGGAWP